MASTFMDSVKNIADSISSSKNCFTWDSAMRKFQYGIAGIILATLSIFETTNRMQCSTSGSSTPEYHYASSYCQEATWYYITSANDTKKVQYSELLRDFKWYILIPPAFTVIAAVLYGALVDSFITRVLRNADQINSIWSSKMEESISNTGTVAIDNTMLSLAIRARIFSETHMHCQEIGNCPGCCKRKSSNASRVNGMNSYGAIDNDSLTDFYLLDYDNNSDSKFDQPVIDKLGYRTALYYQLYLGFCFLVNICGIAFLNPYFFWFPSAVACYYRKEDLTFHWSICSVPGHRYSRVALIIIMLNHTVGAIVALLSLAYLYAYIPSQIGESTLAISSYTRNTQQQLKILQFWKKHGKNKLSTLTATTKFLLALIYQNIDRLLCYRLVLAMIDIEKDDDAIISDLPHLIKRMVDIDAGKAGVFDEEREELIREIRETVMNPAGKDYVKNNIQENILMKWIQTFVDNPTTSKELFQCQLIQRVTGVQLPSPSKEVRDKLSNLIEQKKESEFVTLVEYSRYLSALYDLSKSKTFFSLLKLNEIGALSQSESLENISDNGHETIDGHEYDAAKAFGTSGYCWRSADATAYNWIKRIWKVDHTIQLVAIQGSHTNEKSTPIHFCFTAKLLNAQNGIEEWEEVSDLYQSYDWLKDEWRVFLLVTATEGKGRVHPRTKELQINILKNDGAEYYEIQKIKVFGSN